MLFWEELDFKVGLIRKLYPGPNNRIDPIKRPGTIADDEERVLNFPELEDDENLLEMVAVKSLFMIPFWRKKLQRRRG